MTTTEPAPISLQPLGIIHTPYKQKFAIPRQPGLVSEAIGEIRFFSPFNDINCFRGIEQFSHLWLLFRFHQVQERGWKPTVRPPRLGGNQRVGVFASRSTHRPNGLGLSVVEFVSLKTDKGQVSLQVRGMDLLDGTPIVDIKPYLPYADAHPGAAGGFASQAPQPVPVRFSADAMIQLEQLSPEPDKMQRLIQAVLAQDPRPAYKSSQSRPQSFAIRLDNLNIHWQSEQNRIEVVGIENICAEKA
ncbi:tRNA (N6-threonylcarbamoyladenosine(37)-N6)-methyltransferase TrmO [Lacimicrobium alkaliphilum]|uniref:tRNA-Thr(GGU) m(6)t(6)A37 methyltransferase TsaA n=1 Tax=Lacimicrobium alkaliphilum TaxID=1526571 RepID=A0A0U3B806_9ALTE|nr:tRNA (N6-threonylcarbamoyladenosine(37)-N6)-methyltransferase TrmO [Lacimicrobium alkaliphilum]ALS97781.1 tRNA-Thr(GGU) m(6)t(6)A37 methyltransferase TsaA [Lacimicrobium alkaliphilum]